LLRERGFDAVSAYEVGNADLSDPEHLVYAAAQDRALLTFNSKDFAVLFDRLWWERTPHPGIIVSEQLPLGELLVRVLRMLDSVTADEMRNGFRNLGEFAAR
jgi:predicted nuclease of predicted toxin-antitoxin system